MDSSGSPDEHAVADARARRAHDSDPLGMETAGDETENLSGGVVEPLRVVDDADERLLLGDLGEQRQRGQPDQEPVGRSPRAQSEHRGERIALRIGQAIDSIHHRRAELMEPAVGQLHLGLDADSPGDVPARHSVGYVVEQSALPHARLRHAAR